MKDKSKCPTCCSEVNYHVEGGTSYYTPVDDGLRKLIEVSGGLKCPNCDDTGVIPEQDGYGEWYPAQCEFCYTVEDSVFNRNATKLREGA